MIDKTSVEIIDDLFGNFLTTPMVRRAETTLPTLICAHFENFEKKSQKNDFFLFFLLKIEKMEKIKKMEMFRRVPSDKCGRVTEI